jgi:hypothetical protein
MDWGPTALYRDRNGCGRWGYSKRILIAVYVPVTPSCFIEHRAKRLADHSPISRHPLRLALVQSMALILSVSGSCRPERLRANRATPSGRFLAFARQSIRARARPC